MHPALCTDICLLRKTGKQQIPLRVLSASEDEHTCKDHAHTDVSLPADRKLFYTEPAAAVNNGTGGQLPEHKQGYKHGYTNSPPFLADASNA